MIVVSTPTALEQAWSSQYRRLAGEFAKLLPSEPGTLIEVGCGIGQLTVPLARLAEDWNLKGIDNFKGSYSGGDRILARRLAKARLSNRVGIIISDFEKWFKAQQHQVFDSIVSSEFLPELDSTETKRFISLCYQKLRQNGLTAHSFLSPLPRNERQRLLIQADSNPTWTTDPPKEWFSPTTKLMRNYLRQSGFVRIHETVIKSGLVVKGKAARSMASDWGGEKQFLEQV